MKNEYIKLYIEKVIKGGWCWDKGMVNVVKVPIQILTSEGHKSSSALFKNPTLVKIGNYKKIPFSEIILDPLAWQAVGKVEGWHTHNVKSFKGQGWWIKMHDMIDALAEASNKPDFYMDKTIESFLKILFTK